ncbi:hypothetical protein [Noviherbaspirillum autotrophicum]|uniref:hypothetical protein n=1 Tax=Noviherbaspirillum autotrophicum TaxID=709839 RepID=UPI0012FE621A|nr:hypothetical protein [Noviherbaspirillum autotrophicum]
MIYSFTKTLPDIDFGLMRLAGCTVHARGGPSVRSLLISGDNQAALRLHKEKIAALYADQAERK